MGIKIGSFNLYKMSYQKDNKIAKDYEKIARIIKETDFDILAVQEVLTDGSKYIKSPLEHLIDKLGSDTWDYIWKAPKSKSVQAAEGYAFIWNKTRFRLATGTTKEEYDSQSMRATKTFRGRIETDYHGLQQELPGISRRLVRDPLYARFESIYGWYEIRLINTHIMFSSSKDEDTVSESDATKRNHEFDILADIYRQVDGKVYRSKRPHYTILLGDYNLSLDRAHTKWPYLKNEAISIKEGKNGEKCIVTVQSDLTTLKQKVQDSATVTQNIIGQKPISKKAMGKKIIDLKYYANNYDHFTYDKIRFTTLARVSNACRIDTLTPKKYYNGDIAAHRKEISDHVPILLEFSLK